MSTAATLSRDLLLDPLKFQRLCWPQISFYDKQVEIIESVRDNDVTMVPAGNMLGKDFIAAFIALWFFCSRRPCRVVTSSVDGPQLKGVLWGEIRRFIQTSRYKLPIKENDLLIRHKGTDGEIDGLSYLIGRVTRKGEGILGHHVAKTDDGRPRTLFLGDEASGLDNETFEKSQTWAQRALIIGNPYPCTNFFRDGVKRGDIPRDSGVGYHVKVIKIKAEQSPNVRLALECIARGKPVPSKQLVPGVIDYPEYLKRRKLWDPIRQTIGLDAEFYEGAEVLLYPPQWLDRSERIARIAARKNRPAKHYPRYMGVDAAEGGDDSVWTIIDRLGVRKQISLKTSNTIDVPGRTIALINEWEIDPVNVVFDRGGGGKEHADNLRSQGYNVRTVGFGEAATALAAKVADKPRAISQEEGRDERETRYLYKNRRAEMYGLLRQLLDPGPAELLDALGNVVGTVDVMNREEEQVGPAPRPKFGIPEDLIELRRQLAPLPLLYDIEGRLYLPPKDKPHEGYKGPTIKGILGRSPDQADSLVLAVFAMLVAPKKIEVGAMF